MVLWHALNSQRVALLGITEQISQIRQFYLSWIRTPHGGASCTPPLTTRRGPGVTDDDNPSAKRMKWIVQTNVAGTSTLELRNLSSEVEGELRTNYGDEANVEGDDEREDNDGYIREEAPNDPDIRIRQPLGVDKSTLRRSGRLHSIPTVDE
jgi:hypothetical protein